MLRLLRNGLYVGEISCRGDFAKGLHSAIVAPGVFEQVQVMLSPKVRRSVLIPTLQGGNDARSTSCGELAGSDLENHSTRKFTGSTIGFDDAAIAWSAHFNFNNPSAKRSSLKPG